MQAHRKEARPSVSIVFLAFNRCEELRLSLGKMGGEIDYDQELLDVIVVDNASTDGTAAMLRSEFPGVRLIERPWNNGVSGFNDGLRAAPGDYVLALDDDCYLPGDGLSRAVEEAEREGAHLVSFGVLSSFDERHRFDTDQYRTGLFTYWGCAVLLRREVVQALGGYDPEIFVWANEVEFLIRFYDRGFRHLHFPEVVAVHAKEPTDHRFHERSYRLNSRNFAYVVGKLLQPRDAWGVLPALLAQKLRDGLRGDRRAFKGLADTLRGFARGRRLRQPVRPEVSSTYRHNFEDFSNPLRMSRPLRRLALDAVRRRESGEGDLGRREEWREPRRRFYPERRGVLEL